MKKLFFILVLICSAILTACGGSTTDGSDSKSVSTIEKVKKNKKLVIGTAPGYAPLEMMDLERKICWI